MASPKKAVPAWRDAQRSDPQVGKEIFVATKAVSRAHEIGVGAAVGTVGGVYAGGFRGGSSASDPWVCDPWGWRGWNSCGSTWSCWSPCWWWNPCWSYAFYWSWYYPCWWSYSRPYYYYDYCYYPTTTVVYTSPEVVYVDRPVDVVGEGVVNTQSPAAPAFLPDVAAPNPLSIAAQRYLELGDRAFREGRYADAVQFYAKAVEFAPEQGALYLVLADALFAAGDYHYAAYALRRAIELDPALIETSVDKHGFYPDPRLFDEQLAVLERYLNEHPSDRDARLVLALNYLFASQAKESVRVLESSLAAMATDSAAQKILAQARLVAGR